MIVWLVRLEGKIQANEKMIEVVKDDSSKVAALNEKSIDELRIKHENLDSKLLSKISEVEKTLARIEGALAIITKEKE